MSVNQSQQFTFAIDSAGQLMGVGLILATFENKTNITWTMGVSSAPAVSAVSSASSIINSPSPTSGSESEPESAAQSIYTSFAIAFAAIIGLGTSVLLL